MTIDRFTPLKFATGKTARNRVVVPPMASATADADGFATEQTWTHYQNLTKSGAGLVFVEYSFVHQTGKGESNQLGAAHDAQIPGLKKIAQTIQASGALAGLQIVHVGGKTTSEVTGWPLMAPSDIPVPVKGWQPGTPIAMSKDQIALWEDWFVQAAGRAAAAGFDLVELHGAHGYGLNQWLSPLTNQRTDGWGGSILDRSKLLLSIVRGIKARYPQLLLAIRLPASDHFEGGLSIEEMRTVISCLEFLGVDLIDVSSGIGGWRRPQGRDGEGYLVDDATAIKLSTSLPVIGVGGIETGAFIDQALGQGRIDLAAVGRAILKDPAGWGSKNLSSENRSFPSNRLPDYNHRLCPL
jgi:NADPH2 dehydrogenase